MTDITPEALTPTDDEWRLIRENRGREPHDVALRVRRSDTVRPWYVAEQVDGWRRLSGKVPSWAACEGLYFPFPVALQQCSSEAVARWRASLVVGDSLLDLTGGLGVDCYFMGRGLRRVTYVDADERAVRAARHNYGVLGADNVEFVCSRAEDYLEAMGGKVGTIFIDPSRRTEGGGRVFRIGDCQPDVGAIGGRMMEMADNVVVKLSPLLDVQMVARELRGVRDVYAVGAGGECKDLIVRMCAEWTGEPLLHAVHVDGDGRGEDFAFRMSEESGVEVRICDDIGKWLYEPSAEMMKMGAYGLVCARYGVEAVGRGTHIYTGDEEVTGFPGRRLRVVGVWDFSKRGLGEVRRVVSGGASVAVRNFPLSAEALRGRLKVGESSRVFVYGVRCWDGADRLVVGERVM